ncbi:MAG: pilus assembly protein [Planctomycetes bacterium]|nr:pilus assembly protein [Planctomycetota bacterium]
MRPIPVDSWWHNAAASPAMWAYAAIALLCIVFLCVGLRVIAALARTRARTHAGLIHDHDGTATIEFTLVLPILLFTVLLLAQTTMVMVGNIYVHYAAFAATRSAIVMIPADFEGEPENSIVNAPDNPKFERIRRAAAFALTPVSGRMTQGVAAADDLVPAFTAHYDSYKTTAPAWVASRLADQYRYADAATDISVMRTIFSLSQPDTVSFAALPEGAAYVFGPKEPVTVRVTHKLYLAIPYIGALFADGRLEDAESPTTTLSGSGEGARYSLVSSQYTLVNEGVSPELLPPPQLPRIP